MPTPNSPCRVSSIPDGEYPDLPMELTNDTTKAFVEAFEKQYTKASIQEQQTNDFHGFDGWDATIRETTDMGYVVSVYVSVDYGINPSGQHTTTVPASKPFNAVYYTTRNFALRSEGEWSGSVPDSGWKTVACEGE